MSDWDFLHDMHDAGYSADAISDAAAIGYAPWQSPSCEDEETGMSPEEEQQLRLSALDSLERLRQKNGITRAQYLECKSAILK